LIKLEDLPDGFYADDEMPDGGIQPRYTAERFFRKRPEDYQICIAFLAAGAGLLKIARLLKVHHMTVAAVRDAEGGPIDIQKERIRRNIRTAVDVSAERLPEIMASLPAGQMPIATAVLIDKLRDMDGEPTQRVEVTVKGHLTHAALIAELKAFPGCLDIEAQTMGLGAGMEAQKAVVDVDAGRGADGSAVPVEGMDATAAAGAGNGAKVPIGDFKSPVNNS
jgi:hypothetical protein